MAAGGDATLSTNHPSLVDTDSEVTITKHKSRLLTGLRRPDGTKRRPFSVSCGGTSHTVVGVGRYKGATPDGVPLEFDDVVYVPSFALDINGGHSILHVGYSLEYDASPRMI